MRGTPESRQIGYLKQKAARALKMIAILGEGYDCGLAMLQIMKPEVGIYVEEYNGAMRQLKDIDPTFPESWKPL